MSKLKKFNKNKLNTKNILISFAVIIGIMMITIISKSYAIYKLEKKYDLIQSKIGAYSTGDVKVAVLVDGKETDTFPTYETNYKVEKIECTNGVTATFDVENWQLNIADMSATSTKCTVSFNSKETNEIKPVNMSKTELLALNEEIKNTSAKELADYLYPVGSIYMSTEDDTIEKVQEKFGGTWVKYSSGTTLVGDDGETYITNDTSKGSGGSETITLTNSNLPDHNHTTPATNTGTQSANHTHSIPALSGSTNTTGNHSHTLGYDAIASSGTNRRTINTTGSTAGAGSYIGYAGNHSHTVTTNASTTGINSASHVHTLPAMTTNSCINCSSSPINVQDPYTVVYMYKRTA